MAYGELFCCKIMVWAPVISDLLLPLEQIHHRCIYIGLCVYVHGLGIRIEQA